VAQQENRIRQTILLAMHMLHHDAQGGRQR
jgi:hypothetical protein